MTHAPKLAAPDKGSLLAHGEVHAANLSPEAAWELVTSGIATLLDVRTIEERSFVGRVPGSQHVAWATGTAMTRNPHFVRQVSAIAPKDTTLVLLCRNGKRSASAAEALTKAGFARVFNIAEGFEHEARGQLNHEMGHDRVRSCGAI